ncbi:aspartate/glutamate racemase family protein [Nitrosopumilus sp. K4]|uniref:glutamate racemase n=1 Tax=Nitrosopumilus sp. K4 TaxID=2795383 RepID=UPI001BA7A050|nr:aspartate/glutamate racemase family protein [Nitrosopumilus sp. K4]QUC64523.1 aspartate/glutamate racemase family protein [Nitrosopumilus sp. K4]
MAKIAVFDSGLGSLSVIKEIQKTMKAEIIYFADQKNFPYGKKTKSELTKIIRNSIKVLNEKFSPDLIVIGSNTPTVILDIDDEQVIGIRPPIREAEKISKTKNIGVLATQATINSRELSSYIKNSKLNSSTKIHKINGSKLVELVESGMFLTDKLFCKITIKKNLKNILAEKNIDVITLSSTHLPFLKKLLVKEFPNTKFIDPGNIIAKKIQRRFQNKEEERNKLMIFSSDDTKKFEKNLRRLGIKNKVNFLSC